MFLPILKTEYEWQPCNAKVKIKKLNPKAITPSRGSNLAAGYDLYACIDTPVEIPPHTTAKVGTGIALRLPDDTFGGIFARSGLATKQSLRPANCVGVCDADYTGEYIVAVHNDGTETRVINNGDRIAQLIVIPFYSVDFEEVNDLEKTERGDGGFGSTDQVQTETPVAAE